MNTYMIGLISEFKDYILYVNFKRDFSDIKSAEKFADYGVECVSINPNGISLIVNSVAERLETPYEYNFKRRVLSCPKAPPLSKGDIDIIKRTMTAADFNSFIFSEQFVYDEERDYVKLSASYGQVYNQLCELYGKRETFIFYISSCRVQRCRK